MKRKLLRAAGALGVMLVVATAGVTTVVALPIEEPRERRMHGMAHEFTHAIHHRLAGLSGGWERSIAPTLFSEGLSQPS